MKHQTTHDERFRWLGLLAILWAGVQLEAAINTFQTPDMLADAMFPPPLVVGALALAWAVLFGVVGGMLLLKRHYALQWTARLVVVFLLVNTARAGLLAQADYERGRLPFQVITATLLALIPLVYLVYRVMRRDNSDGET